MTSSETRLLSGEGTVGFEMVSDLFINLVFEDFRKAGQDGYLPRPNPNPDDAGPIVRRPMTLPIMAGCDTAWNRTRVCSEPSSTEMQCLRLLRHSEQTL